MFLLFHIFLPLFVLEIIILFTKVKSEKIQRFWLMLGSILPDLIDKPISLITKAVSGHFHESGHRAHDGEVNKVQEGQLVDELYWNTGELDLGQTGILTVEGNKVSYQNVQLQDYLC